MYKLNKVNSNVNSLSLDKDISNRGKALYMYLVNVDASQVDDITISKDTGMSISTITRAKSDLKNAGYIKVTRLTRDDYSCELC